MSAIDLLPDRSSGAPEASSSRLPARIHQAAQGQGRGAGAGSVVDRSAPVSFTMPTPPSVNALFRNVSGKGRVKTSKYDDYIRSAVAAIRRQCVPSLSGEVIAIFGIERPSGLSDLDNRLKGAIDAIVKAGIIEDDRHICGLAASWLPSANGLSHVILMPAGSVDISFHPARNGASGAWIVAPSTEGETHDNCLG